MGIFRQFPYSNFHDMNMDEIIKICRELQDAWNATSAEWASYKEFIDNYFNNLDVTEEVLNAMRVFASDGTLNTILDPVIANATSAWLAEHITITQGETVIDNTLSIAGAAADAKAAGDGIRKNKNISAEASNEIGVYGFELTANNLYPYYDLPLKLKNGVSYLFTLSNISERTNISSVYLYDNSSASKIVDLSLTRSIPFTVNRDIDNARLIVQYTAAPANQITGSFYLESTEADILHELNLVSFNELVINATAGSDLNFNIPVYGEIGDIIYLKIIDDNAIFGSNKKIDIGWTAEGTTYASGKSITVPNDRFIILNNNYDPYSMRAYCAGSQIANTGTFKIIYHNVTKNDNEMYLDKIARPWPVTIPSRAGAAISKNFMPVYGDPGDIIKVKLTDTTALNNNYNVVIALYVNGAQTQVATITAPLTTVYLQLPDNYAYGKMEFYIAGGSVLNTNGLKYTIQNCTAAGIIPPVKHYSSFEVLGDSYSSFKNHMVPADSRYWYPTSDPDAQGYGTGNNVDNIYEMWWYILARKTEMFLTKNVSYSGSTICYDSYGTGTLDGKENSFVQRAQYLDDASVIFVLGGMNDQWAEVTVGSPQYSGWTDADLSQFAPAICKLLTDLRNDHIGCEIIFIIPYYMNSDFKAAVTEACTHFNVPYIELKRQDSVESHPNEAGMTQIANAVIEFLSSNYKLPYYE